MKKYDTLKAIDDKVEQGEHRVNSKYQLVEQRLDNVVALMQSQSKLQDGALKSSCEKFLSMSFVNEMDKYLTNVTSRDFYEKVLGSLVDLRVQQIQKEMKMQLDDLKI